MKQEEHIALDSVADEATRLLTWLDPRLESSGLGEMRAFKLRCAVVELINNSIQHAYRSEPGHPIEVTFRQGVDRVEVEVRDRGPDFDFTSAGDQDPLAESGRGLIIIQAWVDELTVAREDNWNIYRVGSHRD